MQDSVALTLVGHRLFELMPNGHVYGYSATTGRLFTGGDFDPKPWNLRWEGFVPPADAKDDTKRKLNAGQQEQDKKHWMLAEDPYIWFSRRYGNRYYAVARDVVGSFTGASEGLALFQSADGLKWEPAARPKVLDARFKWADGTLSRKNVERPALLFDGEVPIALFGATDGYLKTPSFNLQIPLKAP